MRRIEIIRNPKVIDILDYMPGWLPSTNPALHTNSLHTNKYANVQKNMKSSALKQTNLEEK